jgi:hypothetical protein
MNQIGVCRSLQIHLKTFWLAQLVMT